LFALIVKLKAKKGQEEVLENIISRAAEKVRDNEKDTLMYDIHRKIGHFSEILLYERYKDRAAWEVSHMSKPYIKKLLEELAELTELQPEIEEYEVVEVLGGGAWESNPPETV